MKLIIKCSGCNVDISRKPSQVKRYANHYCSKKCEGQHRIFWGKASYEEQIIRLRKYFEKHVVRKDGCWDWEGTFLSGRGRLYLYRKAIQAHRASWMIHYGPIPENMYVCHSCDNERCSNPAHLYLGTPSKNTIDMVLKGRKKHMKLNVSDVLEIKKLLSQGMQGKIIAEKYNVHKMTISDIKIGRSWSHLK